MVVESSYNLRMRRKQTERFSPPPSSPDSPPPPPRSCCGCYRRRRSTRLAVFKARHQRCVAVRSPPRQSVPGLFPEAEVLQSQPLLPPPPPPPPPPVAGETGEHPVDISSEDEEEKWNIDGPISALTPPPRRVPRNASTEFPEIIACVKSNLVSELVSLPHFTISTMVHLANRDFVVLDWYEDDYTSFYWAVRRFIELNQELSETEKLRNEHRVIFEEVRKRYEELVIKANNAEEALTSAATNLAEAKENVVCARQRLGEGGLVIEAEMELGQGESEVVVLESEVLRCAEFHSRAEVDMKRVGSEVDEANKAVDEAEEWCKEALEGIELMKEELRSFCAP